jgi:hypothetical protein
MELFLQFGHGMMTHTNELLNNWGGGGVILSPRDLTTEQLRRMGASIISADGEPLLDPQCFVRDSDHPRLVAHAYWNAFRQNPTGSFLGGLGTAAVLSQLSILNRSIGVRRHILPGLIANRVSEDWFAFQENMISEAPVHFGVEPLIATIAISSASLLDEIQVEAIVDRAASWAVDGFYIVAEHPAGYLVEDPNWLANLLILASGLKLSGKFVIVGYCGHQMLCLGVANVDVLASGTWLNVRSFPPDKFYSPDEDETSRRATWYYCPQALSEYKLPFLDLARRVGVLDRMRPDSACGSTYADDFFRGAAPTSVNWGEQNAFRHYLTCLHAQAASAHRSTFDETVTAYQQFLDAAEQLLTFLHRNNVRGADRDFRNLLDVNRAAVGVHESARGIRLRRNW